MRIHHHPHHFRTVEVAQHPVNEILIPVEKNRRHSGFGRLLDRLPLAQQGLQVVDEEVFAHRFRFRADQQA
jgi:hypothetical protein